MPEGMLARMRVGTRRDIAWTSLDVQRFLAFHPVACIQMFISSMAASFCVVLLRAALGWHPRMLGYVTMHAIIIIALSFVSGGLYLRLCGGPLLASQIGVASGYSILLGHYDKDELAVQVAGVSACSIFTAISAGFIAQRLSPDTVNMSQQSVAWKRILSSRLYETMWNLMGYYAGVAAGSIIAMASMHMLALHDVTLHVSSWKNNPIPEFRPLLCRTSPKSPGCSANTRLDISIHCVFATILGVLVGRKAVQTYVRWLLDAQKEDKHVSRDFVVAFGEDDAMESQWRTTLRGHVCLTVEERQAARLDKTMMYGEITVAGARTLALDTYLNLHHANQVVDLGMGVGKIALQWFIEYPHLSCVTGVEKVRSRYEVAKEACVRLAASGQSIYRAEVDSESERVDVFAEKTNGKERRLRLIRGNTCNQDLRRALQGANACLVNIDLNCDETTKCAVLSLLQVLPSGCRLASYSELPNSFTPPDVSNHTPSVPCLSLVFRGVATVLTSWSQEYGHTFRLYEVASCASRRHGRTS